jgi:hypothetical protein
VKYFEHVEEAVWAVEVLKETGLPVAASLCIDPEGDIHGVPTGECAVRLVKAGKYSVERSVLVIQWLLYAPPVTISHSSKMPLCS